MVRVFLVILVLQLAMMKINQYVEDINLHQVLCNATTYNYYSKYSLGKLNQLNKTFGLIGQKITSLNDSFWQKQDTNYTIYNAVPTFFYLGSKQRSQIIGNDTVLILGGNVQIRIDFHLKIATKQNLIEGGGTVVGRSGQVNFEKALKNSEFQYYWQLVEVHDMQMNDNFTFEKLQPALSDEYKQNLLYLINSNAITNVTTLKMKLINSVNGVLHFYLANCLHDERDPIKTQYTYIWNDYIQSRGNLTIPYHRRPIKVDLEKHGLDVTYFDKITDYPSWQCGQSVPSLPLDVDQYGGIQQFMELDFYKNTLKYAISKNQLDTDLIIQYWQSRMFQFYAGDLYQVIPKIATQFKAMEEVKGSCKPVANHTSIKNNDHRTFNVSLYYQCNLNILSTKVANFDVGLELTINGIAKADSIDFQMKNFYDYISIYPCGDYVVLNENLAKIMVRASLQRLKGINLFGSGWPLVPKNYPQFMVEYGHTVVYDSTHIEPAL